MIEFSCVGLGFFIEDFEVDDMYCVYQGLKVVFYVIEYKGEVKGCGGFVLLVGGVLDICELKKMYFLEVL